MTLPPRQTPPQGGLTTGPRQPTMAPPRAVQAPARPSHGGGRQALITPTLSSDLGPSVMQRKGDGTLVSRGPGAVDLEDRADAKGNITGRGARRRDVLRSLHTGGTINKRMFDAAQQFIDDCSVASGGGLVANLLAIPMSSGPRSGWPDAQVDALTRVHKIRNHLGFNDGTVFWRVLFVNKSLADCDAEDKFEHGSSARSLKVALTALDIWYERNRGR